MWENRKDRDLYFLFLPLWRCLVWKFRCNSFYTNIQKRPSDLLDSFSLSHVHRPERKTLCRFSAFFLSSPRSLNRVVDSCDFLRGFPSTANDMMVSRVNANLDKKSHNSQNILHKLLYVLCFFLALAFGSFFCLLSHSIHTDGVLCSLCATLCYIWATRTRRECAKGRRGQNIQI